MKIVAFTDHHASAAALRKVEALARRSKADLLVCTGDFTIFDTDIEKVLKSIDAIGIPCIIIPGNHESPTNMKKVCMGKRNLCYLHMGLHRIGRYVFMAYGGGGFAQRDPRFVAWAKDAIASVKPTDIGILLLHGPPYRTALDIVMRSHVGNKDYRDTIAAFSEKIRLVLCGHIHECFHKKDRIRTTRLVNPGSDGTLIEI